MDEFFAQLIAGAAEARAKREKARKGQLPRSGDGQRSSSQTAPGSAAPPPTSRALSPTSHASGPAGPPSRLERPQPAAPTSRAAGRAAATSAIEAVDPFAVVAAAAQTAIPSATSLLAAFSSRDGLLAGIVLSETLAPPLALRPQRDR